jgi:hypothetical protein
MNYNVNGITFKRQDRQSTSNVTQGRVRVTTVVVAKQ